ncbi:MAG TPA: translocation/assembly module TamB domain-containing protein [bacterium]|nr:translocation/assembly module TamB domain-containing protein [bacterium]
MRKLITIPLWFVAFVLALAVGVYVWLTQSSWLKHQLETQINQALGASTQLTLSVGDMSGDLYSGVVFTDLMLTTRRAEVVDTLAQVGRITVDYDLRDLLPDQRRIRSVAIERLRLQVPRDSIESIFRKAKTEVAERARLEGALELSVESLSLRDGIIYRIGEPEPLADSVRVDASFHAAGGRWTVAIAPSSAWTTWVGPVTFEGLISSGEGAWRFDSLSVATGKSSFVLVGTLNNLQIRSARLDLEELTQSTNLGLEGVLAVAGNVSADTKRKSVSGALELTGTFEGYELDGLRLRFVADSSGVTGDSVHGVVCGARFDGRARFVWSVKPERWEFRGRVERFDLNRFARGTLPTLLSGQVDINAVGTTDADLRIRADVRLGPGHIDSIYFQSADGSLGATVDSLLVGEDFAVMINGASLVGGGTMAFADSVDLFAAINVDDLRPFDRMVFVDSLAGRADGYAYLSGLTSDPDLAAFINSDSLRLFDLRTDQFEARFFVPHFLSNPGGQVDARWGRASTWGIETDSIDLHATLAGRRIDIEWARWYSPLVDIEGSGTLDWSADTIPLDLYPLTLRWENQTYSASNDVRMVIDSAGFRFNQFQFEGPLGIFSASGRMNFDNSMALDFELDRFRIERVWNRFFPNWQLDGIIAARGQLNGTFKSPQIEMAGDVSELTFEGEELGALEGNVSYRDRVLTVESAQLENRYFQAEAAGTFPLDLRFEKVEQRVLNTAPFAGRLHVAGDNLDPINRFLPQTIESVRGDFAIRAAVTGTPLAPRFSGEATLARGTIKAIEILNPLEDVFIDVALRQDTVVVRKVTAVMRDRELSGTVDVKGTVRIESVKSFDYDLAVTGRGVPARMEFKDFFVLSDFDLAVRGATPPKVTGTARPRRIEDREPFTETEARPVFDTTLWDWDIAIELPQGGYVLRNDQVEAELSANLRLMRDRGVPSYIGTAEFVRGKIYLFDKTGRIKRGTLTFDDPLKADPQLDIDVGFRIQQPRVAARTETSSSPVVDLNLHVSGRASEPLIQPEAPYSEQDVLLLLAANTTAVGGGDSLAVSDPLADRLKFAATGLVFSEVQRVAARKLGLETLEINSGDNPFDASITVGRYFTPQLYLYGTSPIDAGAGQEVGFEYRLNRHMFFEGNRDKNNLYRLNLHFNWEY